MSPIDWIVLGATLLFIVGYGMWKSRGDRNIDGYLLAGKTMPWYVVGISVMATQASAITFLSAPGQAYIDGMRFVQFYLGLPLAMIVLCITFIPIFNRLKVFTAYEFLEGRFDLKTRALTAFLFLTQRGIACGLTIYAPSIILSSLLGWNIYYTNLLMGGLVVLYTVSGGSKAVSITQVQQMAVIFIGMALAAIVIVKLLPEDLSMYETFRIAGEMGRLNTIDLTFNHTNQYTLWSGLIGGFFLALSYFGTDQSQVGRYLSGKSTAQSRLGLLMNGFIKIPMQFFILLIGVLLFVYYQFQQPPLNFNSVSLAKVENAGVMEDYRKIESEHAVLHSEKKAELDAMVTAIRNDDEASVERISGNLNEKQRRLSELREETAGLIKQADKAADTNDTNYIFLSFVINHFPAGLIGLLIAVIFCASMSSTSSELNALASTTMIDIWKRLGKKEYTPGREVIVSRLITVCWGMYAIGVAMFANKLGSLIEAVNKLGSLFYGTILGIFVVAFYLKRVTGNSVFIAAIIAELIVVLCYQVELTAFLWLNFIGCVTVVIISLVIEQLRSKGIRN